MVFAGCDVNTPPVTYPTAEQAAARAQVLAANAERMFAFFERNARAKYLAPWELGEISRLYREIEAELKAAGGQP
jgi:hypothetical protein